MRTTNQRTTSRRNASACDAEDGFAVASVDEDLTGLAVRF